jgi:hypothetical protein
MKKLDCASFDSVQELMMYANEKILTKTYTTIVSITVESDPYCVDTFKVWWTEYTEAEPI